MIAILVLIFAAVSLGAAGFVVLPLLRRTKEKSHGALLALGAGMSVLVLGLGVYAMLGQPRLALRALTGPDNTDFTSLIAELAGRIRERPGDIQGWTILGRGYLALGRADEAAKAYARAVELAEVQDRPSTELLIGYGVALSVAGGQVTKEAEAAFRQAYELEPMNPDARYYLGYALAERGDKEGAMKLWDGLVAEAPPDAPWRASLPGQIAALKGESATPPEVQAMVAGLAARLETNPNDLDGWIMLIRSYAALGEKEKAHAALAKARSAFAKDTGALATIAKQAQASGLD